MSIENAVKDVITQKLEEGLIERLVAENLEKGINKALEDLLGSWGDVTKVIKDKIKDVMVKQLSSYDYSKYLAKLDHVLTEILKNTALDNKKILENFKELMNNSEIPKVVKVSDIFKEWKRYVSENVDTSKLEIDYDDGVSYEYVPVAMEVEHGESRSWSSFKHAKIVLECEKDEELNYEIRLSKYQEYPWELSMQFNTSIESLRHL
ncbi:MAG: hypothetical protein HGA49_11670, partial [Eubacteriaceae bacterium]|nr:hypothetical protein [Eubacteriaceae bacterium]